jgi:hypothetical protein
MPTLIRAGQSSVLALGLLLAANAQAGFISATSTTTTMGSQGANFDITNLSDQSCLSSASLTATCTNDTGTGTNEYVWLSPEGIEEGTIDFAFSELLTLTGMSIWNLNFDSVLVEGASTDQISLFSSTDGTTFTALSFSVNGGGAALIGNLTGLTSASLVEAADFITFASIDATHIRLEILTNVEEANFVGLSEVAFDGTPTGGGTVPAPSTALLLAPVLGMLGLRRRRQKAC